ncbi:MAG: polyphosphate kinase 1 [Intestinibacter sp.]|uniref:polyphosphate kinase 1 n=1 Tax=Intestinibacter sp. TaxID=1965304 RepID=UPI002A7ED2A2|nr:polyphosphate kinase 1 [Intestinibacter sp.]MDY4576141.1 polyphosphate kinase 1 [Intestinibacter sp.]
MNKMYDYPQNFFNRELSWLEFNKRVLDEARNEENPLLERVKFLSIFNSNLDEFFMVRVASLLLPKLFSSHEVLYSCSYRITKDADLDVDEEDAMDLLETMEESLKQRKWGDAVRLEIESNGNVEYFNEILDIIVDEIEIDEQYIFKINGIIDFTFLNKLGSVEGFDELKYEKVKMANIKIPHRTDIFGYIKEKDIFVHHPYESFDIIVDMVKKAAEDPNVLAIKQTLYRVSGNSPIIEALTKAAEKGKQVTVLVELKARFDEENNITWAKKLEKAGCHVIYGVIGLKTHCKILLVVRKEKDKIKRYVHFGTGNYNDVTAKFYTDMGILTADEQFGKDASTLFNMLSGYASPDNMKKITIAPYGFRDKFEKMIRREAENAKKGKKAKIIAKMNSLLDKSITTELYAASQAGVEIELIVRGICCLKSGIKGLSENIKVRSIVGRYLEHSRIYYFYNDGKEELYISSGDWMYRNLNKRVETMGIVEDKDIQQEIKEILDLYLKDNVKAKILKSDGSYEKKQIAENEKRINAQEELVKFTHNKNKSLEKEFSQTLIIPIGK